MVSPPALTSGGLQNTVSPPLLYGDRLNNPDTSAR
jgi:hypothetical protein